MVKLCVSAPWRRMRGAEAYLHSFLTSAPHISELGFKSKFLRNARGMLK
jgi:hypothetical protein